MSRYVIKSLKKFKTYVLNYFFYNSLYDAGASYEGGALGINLSCSGSRFNEPITGQQNMFSVGILEVSSHKVDSNAADTIPFLPIFSTFLTSFDLIFDLEFIIPHSYSLSNP